MTNHDVKAKQQQRAKIAEHIEQFRARGGTITKLSAQGVPMSSLTHYAVLCYAPTDSHAALRLAYKAAARAHHPDRGGDADAMAQVNTAYRILSNHTDRLHYNALLQLQPYSCNACDALGTVLVARSLRSTGQTQVCPTCRGTGQQP